MYPIQKFKNCKIVTINEIKINNFHLSLYYFYWSEINEKSSVYETDQLRLMFVWLRYEWDRYD